MTDDELWQDIEERRQATLARRAGHGPNFVSAADLGITSKPAVLRIGSQAPAPMQIDAPLTVQTVQRVTTSSVDRAKGFTIKALPLSVAVGVGGLLIAVGIGFVPLASMGALLVLFLAFLLTWLAAFVWSESASPDGVTLWQVLLHYRLLSREQKARLQRMELDE